MFGMPVRIGTRVPRNLLAANGLKELSTLNGTHHGVDFPGFDRSVCSLNVLDRHLELFCCVRNTAVCRIRDALDLLFLRSPNPSSPFTFATTPTLSSK